MVISVSSLDSWSKSILAAHLPDGATGRLIGPVQAFSVVSAWKQPDATHAVLYKQAETKTIEARRRGMVAASEAADV